jgi:hypothetical protein
MLLKYQNRIAITILIVDDLDNENVREILHDVLTEVYVKSRINNKS